MITPRFSLSQDTTTVSISIRAPYCSLRDLEISVEERVFLFSCRPYYLRLHLPGKIEENEQSKSSFDADSGMFTFKYEKVNVGEHFPDLEFVTKLLCSKLEVRDGNRKIEVLEAASNSSDVATKNDDEANIEYGFAMRGGYDFKILNSEFQDVFEIDPHETPLEERQIRRKQIEQEQFDSEHYMADLLDSEEINELKQLPAPYKDSELTPKELDFLKDLPNVSYSLSSQQIKYCHNCLIEILYAYCYDCRTTYFESTCESGWTISKISATLSWFDGFLNPKQAVICAFRRSLIYPLYRNFNLCQEVLNDLKLLLKLGEKFIIKCLIEIYDIFLKGDSGRYVLNNLYIKDYIVYIMKWDKNLWAETVQEIMSIKIDKKDLGLNLVQIEDSFNSEDDLNTTMGRLNINEQQSDTDSDDLSSSSEEESESSTDDSED